MAHWLRANGYCGRQTPSELVKHLSEATTGRVTGSAAEASELSCSPWSTCSQACVSSKPGSRAGSRKPSWPTRRPDLSPACRGPEPSGLPPCSLRSAIAVPYSPTPWHSPRRPGSRRRPVNPASTSTSPTAAAATSSCAPALIDWAQRHPARQRPGPRHLLPEENLPVGVVTALELGRASHLTALGWRTAPRVGHEPVTGAAVSGSAGAGSRTTGSSGAGFPWRRRLGHSRP